MKLFYQLAVVACLGIGLVQQVNAGECKKIEFAELKSLSKGHLEMEYCIAKIYENALTEQIRILHEKDRNTLEGASLDRLTGGRPVFDTSEVGKAAEQKDRARQDCQNLIERISRIATKKKYKLTCSE